MYIAANSTVVQTEALINHINAFDILFIFNCNRLSFEFNLKVSFTRIVEMNSNISVLSIFEFLF